MDHPQGVFPGFISDKWFIPFRGPGNTKEFNTCVVCGERSEQVALHYSRMLCNGCRAFFKRTVQKKVVIGECRAQGRCRIDVTSRKICKQCRYNACIRAGVDASKVQHPRDQAAEAVGGNDEVNTSLTQQSAPHHDTKITAVESLTLGAHLSFRDNMQQIPSTFLPMQLQVPPSIIPSSNPHSINYHSPFPPSLQLSGPVQPTFAGSWTNATIGPALYNSKIQSSGDFPNSHDPMRAVHASGSAVTMVPTRVDSAPGFYFGNGPQYSFHFSSQIGLPQHTHQRHDNTTIPFMSMETKPKEKVSEALGVNKKNQSTAPFIDSHPNHTGAELCESNFTQGSMSKSIIPAGAISELADGILSTNLSNAFPESQNSSVSNPYLQNITHVPKTLTYGSKAENLSHLESKFSSSFSIDNILGSVNQCGSSRIKEETITCSSASFVHSAPSSPSVAPKRRIESCSEEPRRNERVRESKVDIGPTSPHRLGHNSFLETMSSQRETDSICSEKQTLAGYNSDADPQKQFKGAPLQNDTVLGSFGSQAQTTGIESNPGTSQKKPSSQAQTEELNVTDFTSSEDSNQEIPTSEALHSNDQSINETTRLNDTLEEVDVSILFSGRLSSSPCVTPQKDTISPFTTVAVDVTSKNVADAPKFKGRAMEATGNESNGLDEYMTGTTNGPEMMSHPMLENSGFGDTIKDNVIGNSSLSTDTRESISVPIPREETPTKRPFDDANMKKKNAEICSATLMQQPEEILHILERTADQEDCVSENVFLPPRSAYKTSPVKRKCLEEIPENNFLESSLSPDISDVHRTKTTSPVYRSRRRPRSLAFSSSSEDEIPRPRLKRFSIRRPKRMTSTPLTQSRSGTLDFKDILHICGEFFKHQPKSQIPLRSIKHHTQEMLPPVSTPHEESAKEGTLGIDESHQVTSTSDKHRALTHQPEAEQALPGLSETTKSSLCEMAEGDLSGKVESSNSQIDSGVASLLELSKQENSISIQETIRSKMMADPTYTMTQFKEDVLKFTNVSKQGNMKEDNQMNIDSSA